MQKCVAIHNHQQSLACAHTGALSGIIMLSFAVVGAQVQIMSTDSETRPEDGVGPSEFKIINHMFAYLSLEELPVRVCCFWRSSMSTDSETRPEDGVGPSEVIVRRAPAQNLSALLPLAPSGLCSERNLTPLVSGFSGGRVKQHPIANPNRRGGEAFGVRTTWALGVGSISGSLSLAREGSTIKY